MLTLFLRLSACMIFKPSYPNNKKSYTYRGTDTATISSVITGESHISLTESPFRMRHALKVWGPLDKLKFELEPSKYPNHYTPLQREERKQFHKDLRKMLVERLKNRLQKAKE